jgi:hypothetical protein
MKIIYCERKERRDREGEGMDATGHKKGHCRVISASVRSKAGRGVTMSQASV